MTAKIYEIKSGKELKGAALRRLREDAAQVLTATDMSRQEATGFQPIGYAAARLLAPLERKLARST